MPEPERTYIAIDLKSFFASVECVERGLDPLTTNLVVADVSRTEKTICLAEEDSAHGKLGNTDWPVRNSRSYNVHSAQEA